MPSIGKDLATIREHLGFTIDDIREATKIPMDTLKSIEDGSLFEESDEIKTYVRSFVRSYARALKLNEEQVVQSLNQQESGNYYHLLLNDFPALHPAEGMRFEAQQPEPTKATPRDEEASPDAPAHGDKESSKQTPPDPKPEASAASTRPSGAVDKSQSKLRSVDWADMGKRFAEPQHKTPVWVIGIVIVAVVLFISVYLMVRFDAFSGSETIDGPADMNDVPETVEGPSNGLILDLTDQPPEESAITELDDILYLTILAATGPMDPVRVWSDEKPRIDPYWIEQGTGFNFEFRDTIRLRGRYSDMLLFLNGHRIDNPRVNHFNSEENMVELTRSLFDSDPKWASPVPLELPDNVAAPDSIVNRPAF
ncbi:MAG: helix-turn-helix domain-containing protein [Balneolaceae bacterium]